TLDDGTFFNSDPALHIAVGVKENAVPVIPFQALLEDGAVIDADAVFVAVEPDGVAAGNIPGIDDAVTSHVRDIHPPIFRSTVGEGLFSLRDEQRSRGEFIG